MGTGNPGNLPVFGPVGPLFSWEIGGAACAGLLIREVLSRYPETGSGTGSGMVVGAGAGIPGNLPVFGPVAPRFP